MFVTTTSEKGAVAERIGKELKHVSPGPRALRVFDAGMGDGTVLSHVMRHLHREFTHIPWLVVGKEISMEDVRMSLEKLPDRFFEHPETVFVATNLYYSEAPWLRPGSPRSAAGMRWHNVSLRGSTAHEFARQIHDLHDLLASDWQVTASPRTGNLMYAQPATLVIYREDREFILRSVIPQPGSVAGEYNLIIARRAAA